jgi:hypothetical protein
LHGVPFGRYITTQPRGPQFGKDFWCAGVSNMINACGAPVAADDVDKIVDSLSRTY